MAVVESAKEADLLAAIEGGGGAGVKATILWCEGRHPASFEELVDQVCPNGLVAGVQFDALADGWEFHRTATAIHDSPTHKRPPEGHS